jgi:hypothetical protein
MWLLSVLNCRSFFAEVVLPYPLWFKISGRMWSRDVDDDGDDDDDDDNNNNYYYHV